MKTFYKFILYPLLGLLALLLITLAVIKLIPDSQYQSWLSQALHKATGRDVEIQALELDFDSSLKANIKGLRLANASWATDSNVKAKTKLKAKPMLSLEQLTLELSLKQLFSGVAEVSAIADTAEVLVQTDAKGVSNWLMSQATADEQTANKQTAVNDTSIALKPLLRKLQINNLLVNIEPASGEAMQNIQLKQLLIETPDDVTSLSLQAEIQGEAIKIDGNLGKLEQLLSGEATNMQLVGQLGSNQLAAKGSWGPIQSSANTDVDADVDAGVDSAMPFDLTLDSTISSLSSLAAIAGQKLVDFGQLDVKARLLGQADGKISLLDMQSQWLVEQLKLDVTGDIQALQRLAGIKLQAKLDGTFSDETVLQLETFLQSFGVALPSEQLPQSVNISTAIEGDLKQLALHQIKASIQDKDIQLQLNGSVENAMQASGVLADIQLESDSLSSFDQYVGKALPASKPINLQVNLKAETLEQASIQLAAQSDGIEAKVSSQLSLLSLVEDIKQGKPLAIAVQLQAPNLRKFAPFVEQQLPDKGPLDLSTRLGIKAGTYHFDAIKLSLADYALGGDLSLTLPDAGRPYADRLEADRLEADSLVAEESQAQQQSVTKLHGQLHIVDLDLSFLLPEPEPEAVQETAQETAQEKAKRAADGSDNSQPDVADLEAGIMLKRLLPTEKILLAQLNQYDLDLQLTADNIKLGQTHLNTVQLPVLLKNGLLTIGPFNSQASPLAIPLAIPQANPQAKQSGSIDGTIELDGQGKIPKLDANIKLAQVPMPNIGGELDLALNIKGQGQSVAELMAGLDGKMMVLAREAKIEKSFASRFGNGLLSFAEDQQQTTLECLALHVDISDGVADFKHNFAAQLTEVTWLGGGTVDFNSEKIDIDISPKPRKGITISLGGELANLVKLGGTLQNPQVLPDFKEVALEYAKYSAYVATGGLSLLSEIIYNKIKANEDVCEQILGGQALGGQALGEQALGRKALPADESIKDTEN